MLSTHTVTATLAFQLATDAAAPATTEEQLRALCERLGIQCNAALIEALGQPALGQRVEELLLQARRGLQECTPWAD